MIRIIDLKGFQRVEDVVRLYYRANGSPSPEVDNAVALLSKETFGIVEDDAVRCLDMDEDELSDEMADRFDVFYRFFGNVENSDDDAVAVLALFGIDFTDAKGWPLLCTRFFKWQALAAACGIAGKLPDPEAAGLQTFENSLQAEATRFMGRGRKG